MDNTFVRELLWGGLMLALGIVFPIMFHMVGLGSAFLPMFLPVFTLAYLVRLKVSLSVAFLTPLVSSFLTGMPPIYPPIVIIMVCEFIILVFSAVLTKRVFHLPLIISVIISIIVNRLFLAAFFAFLEFILGIHLTWLSIPAILKGIPGVILLIITVPPAVQYILHKYIQPEPL